MRTVIQQRIGSRTSQSFEAQNASTGRSSGWNPERSPRKRPGAHSQQLTSKGQGQTQLRLPCPISTPAPANLAPMLQPGTTPGPRQLSTRGVCQGDSNSWLRLCVRLSGRQLALGQPLHPRQPPANPAFHLNSKQTNQQEHSTCDASLPISSCEKCAADFGKFQRSRQLCT